MKSKLQKSLINPVLVIITAGFLMWVGSTLFTISGNQRELQAKVNSIEKDTAYLRSRFDDLVESPPNDNKTIAELRKFNADKKAY